MDLGLWEGGGLGSGAGGEALRGAEREREVEERRARSCLLSSLRLVIWD